MWLAIFGLAMAWPATDARRDVLVEACAPQRGDIAHAAGTAPKGPKAAVFPPMAPASWKGYMRGRAARGRGRVFGIPRESWLTTPAG